MGSFAFWEFQPRMNLDFGYLLPFSTPRNDCFTPFAIYHTATKEASAERICKEIGFLFPNVPEHKHPLLTSLVRRTLETEDSDEAWEIRIQNFGHTLLALRNTEHTLQAPEKRFVYHVVMENMELESWDMCDAALLVIMYFVGFWCAWFLQLYMPIKADRSEISCGTCPPIRSIHWTSVHGPYF
jgi:hypothetical protein